jgi:hypothetical protein
MRRRPLELEVAQHLERHREARDESGSALVARNRKAQPRKGTIGSGTMEVTALRVRDERSAGSRRAGTHQLDRVETAAGCGSNQPPSKCPTSLGIFISAAGFQRPAIARTTI